MDRKYFRTALIWAILRGQFDIIDLLIKRGADVNARDQGINK